MRQSIDIAKLDKDTKILLETKDTIFEIVVISPNDRLVAVNGGIKLVYKTKAKIKQIIKKGSSVEFWCEGLEDGGRIKTSPVVSATIYSHDGSWHYDAIEKEKRR